MYGTVRLDDNHFYRTPRVIPRVILYQSRQYRNKPVQVTHDIRPDTLQLATSKFERQSSIRCHFPPAYRQDAKPPDTRDARLKLRYHINRDTLRSGICYEKIASGLANLFRDPEAGLPSSGPNLTSRSANRHAGFRISSIVLL